MRVSLRQKNIKITPPLAEYIDRALIRRIEKLLAGGVESELPILDIEISRTTRHHKKGKVYRVSARLTHAKTHLYASVDNEDIRAACDLLEEALRREIKKNKGRLSAKEKRQARVLKKEKNLAPAARLYRKGRIRGEGM